MTTLAMFKMIQKNFGFSNIGDLMKLYAGHSAPSPNLKPFHIPFLTKGLKNQDVHQLLSFTSFLNVSLKSIRIWQDAFFGKSSMQIRNMQTIASSKIALFLQITQKRQRNFKVRIWEKNQLSPWTHLIWVPLNVCSSDCFSFWLVKWKQTVYRDTKHEKF